VISVVEPKSREAGIKVDSAAALIDKLKNEAGVL
jgi:electron transfer flavoprotein beta subunit